MYNPLPCRLVVDGQTEWLPMNGYRGCTTAFQDNDSFKFPRFLAKLIVFLAISSLVGYQKTIVVASYKRQSIVNETSGNILKQANSL